LAEQNVSPAPSRSSVYRVLTRNGLTQRQEQQHRRRYRRWQRDSPMQLWQLDIMGGVFLAGGRECKLVTGIDDHSRFVVIARVVAVPSGRAVCEAFTEAMASYGVPSEVLTDNGKQFTGRFTKPRPAEVLFERVCRENGITARLTKPRSPTTTGKIERFHATLRREMLDDAGPFADETTAQAAIVAWVQGYNHRRPHQSVGMATPASVFRPNPSPGIAAVPIAAPARSTDLKALHTYDALRDQPSLSEDDVHAVEIDMVITPAGRLCLPGNQNLKFSPSMAGRPVTVWANDRSIHVLHVGELIRTRPSRLSPVDLTTLVMRGARIGGAEPGPSALPTGPLQPMSAVEVERTANATARIDVGGQRITLAAHLAGQQVTLRFEGALMHVIAGERLVQTFPAPIPFDRRARLAGARTASTPLPPPPAPPARAQRRVPKTGEIMVAKQRLYVGPTHAGKTVTVVIEDTVFRVLHSDIELGVHARKNRQPVTRFKAFARRPEDQPASHNS